MFVATKYTNPIGKLQIGVPSIFAIPSIYCIYIPLYTHVTRFHLILGYRAMSLRGFDGVMFFLPLWLQYVESSRSSTQICPDLAVPGKQIAHGLRAGLEDDILLLGGALSRSWSVCTVC